MIFVLRSIKKLQKTTTTTTTEYDDNEDDNEDDDAVRLVRAFRKTLYGFFWAHDVQPLRSMSSRIPSICFRQYVYIIKYYRHPPHLFWFSPNGNVGAD